MIRKAKGTRDFINEEVLKIEEVERVFKNAAKKYGFSEIKTPTFEKTSLFKRGVGESTDIVTKEMFNVISSANLKKYLDGNYDLNKNGLTLRPEGTAPVVRAFIENNLYATQLPVKLCYNVRCFRNERPQAGRFREFTQFGAEVFGSESPFTDAELIAMVDEIIKELSISDYEVLINSIGCKKCRSIFEKELLQFLETKLDKLCANCNDRYERNPLRVLDCKNEQCLCETKDHPDMLDFLCDECSEHFEELKRDLDLLGVQYKIDTSIVRGLDYYIRTSFEIKTNLLGAQSAICGGGRYDGLVKSLDGPELAGVGFGIGMDRLIMAADASGHFQFDNSRKGVLVINLGVDNKHSIEFLKELRNNAIYSQLDHLGRSLKSSMKYANKLNYKYVAILGEEEVKEGKVTLKNLDTSEQICKSREEVLEYIRSNDNE